MGETGHSTIAPTASIPRIYPSAYLNASQFLELRPFSTLIKGAAYVASDCHRRDTGSDIFYSITSLYDVITLPLFLNKMTTTNMHYSETSVIL